MTNVSGKTALVTGASRGIGRAIAQRLAGEGALVAVHYGSNEVAAKETVTSIEQAGGRAFPVRAPLGVDGDVEAVLAGLAEGLNGRGLDILVNNAADTKSGTLEETTVDTFDRLFAVNAKAPFFLIQKALPLMPDGGRIINVSSAVGRIAMPEVAYAMTKGAIEALGRALANALGDRGITVNTIAPGVTATDANAWMRDMPEAKAGVAAATALGRIGQPSDVADAVAFLASGDSRWVTGHVLDATGGLFLGPRV